MIMHMSVLLCIALLPMFGQVQTPPSATLERDFQAAMAAEDRGDLDTARDLLLSLKRRRPGVFAIDESLGLIDVAQQKFTEALPLLQAAAREQPDSDAAHANLGATLYKLHRNREALAEFEEAARLNPNNGVTQQSLGELWLDAGKPNRAADAFSAAIRLKPGDDLTFSYAAALVAGKHYDEAAKALASASATDQSALAQSLLGEIDEQKGRFESAAQHLTRAAELDPSEENVWALGMEFLRHWTFEAAVKEFEAGRQRFPSSMTMRLGMGAAYFGNGAYAKAIPEFAALLENEPGNAMYAQMLGIACTAVMQETSAQCGGLVAYADKHPQDAQAATYAATWLLTDANAQQHTAHAERLLQSAVRKKPDLAEAQYQLGVLKQDQSDWSGSVGYLERAVALKPDFAQAHYHLALAYWRSGRKSEGQKEMELQKKYASEEKEELDRRLRQITTFVVSLRQ
jgi:tetratricopeptide (TPR) repeat protein